jgi:hypothetical protein
LNSANGSKDTLISITLVNHTTQLREERDNNFSILWVEIKLLLQKEEDKLLHQLEKFIQERLKIQETEVLPEELERDQVHQLEWVLAVEQTKKS